MLLFIRPYIVHFKTSFRKCIKREVNVVILKISDLENVIFPNFQPDVVLAFCEECVFLDVCLS